MSDVVRPQYSNIDLWGLTHVGKVREENQDHYFMGSLARGVAVDGTSIDVEGRRVLHAERLASLGQMIGGIAHNLKTPIMSVAGGIDQFNREC